MTKRKLINTALPLMVSIGLVVAVVVAVGAGTTTDDLTGVRLSPLSPLFLV